MPALLRPVAVYFGERLQAASRLRVSDSRPLIVCRNPGLLRTANLELALRRGI